MKAAMPLHKPDSHVWPVTGNIIAGTAADDRPVTATEQAAGRLAAECITAGAEQDTDSRVAV